MTTKITGKPNWLGPLKMIIREEIPYRTGELGVSPGYYEGTWNGSDWGINAIMPRYDQPDAIPLGPVSIFISRTDTGAMVVKYDYNPQEWIETSPGVFDLGRAYAPRSFVRTQQIVDVANDATAAAKSVTTATLDLTTQKQTLATVIDQQVERVDGKLADIAQNTELMQQAAGIGRVATEADLADQPAGAYELTGTNERLVWDGAQITPGSRGPMLATAETVPAVITDNNADALLSGINDGKTVQAVQKRVLQLTQSHTLNTASATAQLSGSVLRWFAPQAIGLQLKNLTTPQKDIYHVENDVLSNVRLEMLDAQGNPSQTGIALYAGSDTAPAQGGFNAGGAFRNSWGVHTYGGAVGVQYGHGNWQTRDQGLIVERFSQAGIRIPAGLQQFGEKNVIQGGAVFGALNDSAPGLDIHGDITLRDYSVDYLRTMGVFGDNCRVPLDACYWEADSDHAGRTSTASPVAMSLIDSGAQVILLRPQLVAMPSGAGTANVMFWPATRYWWEVKNGLLHLDSPEIVSVLGAYQADSIITATTPYAQVMVSGQPRFVGNSYAPLCRQRLNRIEYPGWELEDGNGQPFVDAHQWDMSGPQFDSSVKRSGKRSLRFAGNAYAALTVPIHAGQSWLFDLFYHLDNAADRVGGVAGDGLQIAMWVTDSRGRFLTGTAEVAGIDGIKLTGQTSAFTRLGVQQQAMNTLSHCVAPSGAATLNIMVKTTASTTGTAWIDDLTLEIYG